MKPKELEDSTCPLAIILNTSIQSQQLRKISEYAKNNSGTRELRLVVKENAHEYVFISEFKVSSTIKREFQDFEWQDLVNA